MKDMMIVLNVLFALRCSIFYISPSKLVFHLNSIIPYGSVFFGKKNELEVVWYVCQERKTRQMSRLNGQCGGFLLCVPWKRIT